MAIDVSRPVGLRNRATPVDSATADQLIATTLLNLVVVANGGNLVPPSSQNLVPSLRRVIVPGPDKQCPRPLADAIWEFQTHWLGKGVRTRDGVIDPDGDTIKKLNELAARAPGPQPTPSPTPMPVGPGGTEPLDVELDSTFVLRNSVHTESRPVVPDVSPGPLRERQLQTEIREFLFKVTKSGRTFWVGACVGKDVMSFDRAQVYFHPTVQQTYRNKAGRMVTDIYATEDDYAMFLNGWRDHMFEYVPRIGCQLAAAQKVPLLVPFMTMGSLRNRSENMFTAGPIELLEGVLGALQKAVRPGGGHAPKLTKFGVASFSSGHIAMRTLIASAKASGLIKELHDFDSAWITSNDSPFSAATISGAAVKQYHQRSPHRMSDHGREGVSIPGTTILPPPRWANVASFSDSVHHQIGWMLFNHAMKGSVIT